MILAILEILWLNIYMPVDKSSIYASAGLVSDEFRV